MKRIRFFTLILCPFLLVSMAFALPSIKEWSTTEGSKVLYIHAPELPMVDILVAMDAGNYRDGDHYGLASMTANMMTLGTQKRDEHQFAESLERLGSRISVTSSMLSTVITLRSLTEKDILEQTLALYDEMILTPRFDDTILQREKNQAIDAQKAVLDSPDAIASDIFSHALYPNERQGVTSEMLKDSLAKISVTAIESFRQQYYRATHAKIIIVGNVTEDKAKSISQHISKLLGANTLVPSKIANQPTLRPAQEITKHFDSPQSKILMGHSGINRFHPDYFPLILGNHVLGGSGLTSLLMKEIREQKGLTYGITSSFSAGILHGPFTISLSTKNESRDQAIATTRALLKDFIQNGPADEDLNRAKNNLIGSVILDLSSNSNLAQALLYLALYELPLDYFDTYPEKIKSITRDDIKAAFSRHVDPDQFITVIVGGDLK